MRVWTTRETFFFSEKVWGEKRREEKRKKMFPFNLKLETILLFLLLLMVFIEENNSLPNSLKVKEEKFLLGPFEAKTISGRINVPKVKGELFGILSWGDWTILDSITKKIIPRGEFFFHHIFCYETSNRKYFVGGCSDERVPWGPRFRDDQGYIYLANTSSAWTYTGLLSNINKNRTVYIQYSIRYLLKEDIPPHYLRVVGLSYTSVPKHLEQDATREYGEATSVSHISLDGPQQSNATLIFAVGHLHVGGVALNITEGNTGRQLCYSVAVHNTKVKCYMECPTCPYMDEPYYALDTLTYCDDMKERILIQNGFKITPIYDSRCGYKGLHGSVFAWYAPDDQEWFEKVPAPPFRRRG